MNSQSSQNYQSFNDALSDAPQHNAVAHTSLFFFFFNFGRKTNSFPTQRSQVCMETAEKETGKLETYLKIGRF